MNICIKFIIFIILLPFLALYELTTMIADFFGIKLKKHVDIDDLELGSGQESIYQRLGLNQKAKRVVQVIALIPLAIPFMIIFGFLLMLGDVIIGVMNICFPHKCKGSHERSDIEIREDDASKDYDWDEGEILALDPAKSSDELSKDDLLNLLGSDESIKQIKIRNEIKKTELPGGFQWVYKVTGKDHILIHDLIQDKSSSKYCARDWLLALEAIMQLVKEEQHGEITIPSSKSARDKLRRAYEDKEMLRRILLDIELQEWDKEKEAKSRHFNQSFF